MKKNQLSPRFTQFSRVKTILLLALLTLIVSCNPVKQVLKDQVKFNKVAEEVIRRGYCVNDTVIETVIDTLYKTDSLVINTVSFTNGKLDTVFADGSAVYIDDQGNVSVKCPVKQQVRTVTKTETIRDRSLENILKSDISKLDSIKSDLELTIQRKDLSYKELENKLRWQQGKFYLLIAALVAFVGIKLYSRVKKYLPF